MPILGSSTIKGFGATGPTGDPGILGPRGTTGNAGTTKGATGNTGEYIANVTSNRSSNQIIFTTSEGRQTILNGFSGPTGFVYNVSGISSAFGSTFVSGISRGYGYTFSFYGISAGTGISVSSDASKITVTYTPGRDPYTKNPVQDYVPYIQMVSVAGGSTGINSTRIYADTNNHLQFGLTGLPVGTTFNYLYTNLNEEIFTVTTPAVKSQGGITLDLTRGFSNYWIPNDYGITAFVGNTASGVRQEYTLFFAGRDIWNLPKNLYLQNTGSGVSYGGFVKGLNILHIWSDNAGATFNGIFLERGIGEPDPYAFYNLGSCCLSGTCEDNVTEEYCLGRSGTFRSLTTCESRIKSGQSVCGVIVGGATGACCCGITGCIDATNIPLLGTFPDRAFCDSINGKFYQGKTCGFLDKWGQGYTYNRGNTSADYNICHTCGAPMVACCRQIAGGWTCTQETVYYCESIGGTAHYNTDCSTIDCSVISSGGNCRQNGACNVVPNSDCVCGVWYGTNPCQSSGNTGIFNILTNAPHVNIIHSLTVAQYSVRHSLDITQPNKLDFYVNYPSGYTQDYKLDGYIEIEDTGVTYSIWNNTSCIRLDIKDFTNNFINQNDILTNNTAVTVEVSVDLAEAPCSTDQNFKGKLFLNLISCPDGPLLSTQKSVDIIYTNSPCTCLGYSNGDIVNKAPIVVPFTAERYCTHCTFPEVNLGNIISHIPYPLKRQTGLLTFCPPTGISGSQCGIISSFCVYYDPIQELSGCTYSSRFDGNGDYLVAFGINDPNGAYGPNRNGDRGDSIFEGNTLPDGCFHVEYNAPGEGTTYFHKYDPQEAFYPDEFALVNDWYSAGNTDRYTDSDGNDIPLDYADWLSGNYKLHHTRLYTDDRCKRCLYVNSKPSILDCDARAPFDYAYCVDEQDVRAQVKTNMYPGQNGNWLTAFNAAGGILRLLGNPYYNTVKFDDDALTYVAKTYNLDPFFLQQRINRELRKYGKLFDPSHIYGTVTHITANYGITSSDGFDALDSTTKQRLLVDPLEDIGGSAIDVDDKARDSCMDCSKFFNINRIQVPSLAITDISALGADYYAYGLVIEKLKQCSVHYEGTTADSDAVLYCGCNAGPDPDGDGIDAVCPDGCDSDSNKYCKEKNLITRQLKYYAVIIRKPKNADPSCVLVYDIGNQEVVYGGDLNSGNFGSVFCRGGDVICPLDCNTPIKIRELVWLGDLTLNSLDMVGQDPRPETRQCEDSVKVRYTLNPIDKTFTGFDPYRYVSITDPSFFRIDNLNRPTTFGSINATISARLAHFATVTSNIFCKSGTTDYLNSRCSICANDSCYSDVIPKLIEFIGPGCSVEGFFCGATASVNNKGLTFVDGPNDRAKSFVQITGDPVYWLIESKYNSNISGLTIGPPAGTTSITGIGAPFRDTCNTGTSPTRTFYTGLDTRFYQEHNISYLYTTKINGATGIRLSKNIESNGLTACFVIPRDTDGKDWWYLQNSGYTSGIRYCSNASTCSGYVFTPPKLNVNGYRPSILINNLSVTETGTGDIVVRFRPTGAFFRSTLSTLDNIDYNDLNVKVIKLNGNTIEDVTSSYIDPLVPSSSNTFNKNHTDAELDGDSKETGYVIFNITNNKPQFKNDVIAGNLYLLFNVNNSDVANTNFTTNWAAKQVKTAIYSNVYKQYEVPHSNGSGDPDPGWPAVFDNSWNGNADWDNTSTLGDFALQKINAVITGAIAPPISTKKTVNGICINIDCTAINGLCDNLEGC